MMKIVGNKNFKSIQPFEEIDFPNFSVIIGINGSGKTQFLEAMKEGSVAVQCDNEQLDTNAIMSVQSNVFDIKILDSEARSELIQATVDVILLVFNKWKVDVTKSTVKYLRNLNCTVTLSDDILWCKSVAEIIQLIGYDYQQEINSQINNINSDLMMQDHYNFMSALSMAFQERSLHLPTEIKKQHIIRSISKEFDIQPLCITEKHIETFITRPMIDNCLNPKISKIFVYYRDQRALNDMKRGDDSRTGEKTALSNEEFIQKLGIPPWEQLSELLKGFNLPYKVCEPNFDISRAASLCFEDVNNPNNSQIKASDLSSGEQVLLRFALSIFNYIPEQAKVILPKILLLDEMDASLHPEMVQKWLQVIQEYLVKEKQIKVMLTTHSPTTVALVPDDSLYEMIRNEAPPKKISKQEALNHLTVGVPTLAIDFSGQRQVFVESDTDVAVYGSIFEQMKGRWKCSRSLSFISTGVRKDNIEQNTGCAVVKKVVESLRGSGNQSVFGLIDWDQKNNPQDGIKIVGHNEYYTLENILLEPVLIGILVIVKKIEGFPEINISLRDFESITNDKLQKISDIIVQDFMQKNAQTLTGTSVRCRLTNFSIDIDQAYRNIKGHDLEGMLVQTYPKLRNIEELKHGKAGDFSKAIIKWVLNDYYEFYPIAIKDIIMQISED